mmetsp:Transcript_909/g.2576  ORF Transcript_909/g.2576 Transcript_909/m.2576 type:complete len:446 (+) Transcript_909:245-1582(+)
MGNSESTPPEPVIINQDDKYQWPTNLYIEMRDMSALAFLIYAFGYASDVVRRVQQSKIADVTEVAGLHWDPTTKKFEKDTEDTVALPRSFTPQEVLDMLAANRELLRKEFPDQFGDTKQYAIMERNLKLLQERVDLFKEQHGDAIPRPLTLEEYDDRHQKHELVYGITRDDINKRITVVFRGTDNELSFGTNWTTNMHVMKRKVSTKSNSSKIASHTLSGEVQKAAPGGLWFHRGFYNYLFQPTMDEGDGEAWRKYDEILQDLLVVFRQCKESGLEEPSNPYKIYVTGHSLGAALSTMFSFFLANEPDDTVPKPITCIHFASPRIGDSKVRDATHALEQNGKLRILRVWNDKDTVAVIPVTNYYHVGVQLRLFRSPTKNTEIVYPSPSESWGSSMDRVFTNSLLTSFNVRYDHSDYRERIESHKDFLMTKDLRALYKDNDFMGFK